MISPRPALPSWGLIAAAVLLALWAILAGPRDLMLAASLLLAWALLVLAAVDVIDFRLPDLVTLPLAAAGLAVSLIAPVPDPVGHLIGAVAGWGLFALVAYVYRRLRGREGLGLGDAKLMAAAGAWLGWQALPSVILIACAAAFVWIGLKVLRRGGAAAAERLAFGAPLCLAIWLVWLHGKVAVVS